MDQFWLWFYTGTAHILDWNGYDHILYIMVLCVSLSVKEWKKLLILVTAFTIGHSLTLAISALDLIRIPQGYIEVLIPFTIICTCLVNLYSVRRKADSSGPSVQYQFNYSLALLFGLIHGLGFSYLLKSMLGTEESIILPLVSFNLGLEAGQAAIVGGMLLVSAFLIRFTELKKAAYVFIVSLAVFGIALLLCIQRINDLVL